MLLPPPLIYFTNCLLWNVLLCAPLIDLPVRVSMCAFVKWHLSVLTAFAMPALRGIAIIVRAVICREINTHPVNEPQIKYTRHMLTPWKDTQHMVGGWQRGGCSRHKRRRVFSHACSLDKALVRTKPDQLLGLYKSGEHKLLSGDSYISLLHTAGLTVLNKWMCLQLEEERQRRGAEVIV